MQHVNLLFSHKIPRHRVTRITRISNYKLTRRALLSPHLINKSKTKDYMILADHKTTVHVCTYTFINTHILN
ncbi:hypothetical protein HanPI659440_Chr10g0383571 [Helianthus annuus]|nr:hypothetical protein HanPI659440_Chr10g0383571 [Helianthus annuus]